MKILFLIAQGIIIWSCDGKNPNIEDDSGNTIISLLTGPDTIISNISDIAYDIKYIPLQKTSDTQIKAVDKIVIIKNKIYVGFVNDLVCFSDQGQYLYKFSDSKSGSENIVSVIYDFDISSNDSLLIVISDDNILQFQNILNEFVFEKFIETGQLTPSKIGFVPGTDNILVSSVRVIGTESSLSVLINSKGEIIDYLPNYYPKLNVIRSGFQDEIIHYKIDNNISLKERYNDTVYYINQRTVKFAPGIILDSRFRSPEYPVYNLRSPLVINVMEINRYIYFIYMYNGIRHKVFYDKSSGKKLEIDLKEDGLIDDICGGPCFYPEYCSEGKLYSWISARELKRQLGNDTLSDKQLQNPARKAELIRLTSSLKETDNPILIKLTPKD